MSENSTNNTPPPVIKPLTLYPDWRFSSHNDWKNWVSIQNALTRENVKLNIIICPAI